MAISSKILNITASSLAVLLIYTYSSACKLWGSRSQQFILSEPTIPSSHKRHQYSYSTLISQWNKQQFTIYTNTYVLKMLPSLCDLGVLCHGGTEAGCHLHDGTSYIGVWDTLHILVGHAQCTDVGGIATTMGRQATQWAGLYRRDSLCAIFWMSWVAALACAGLCASLQNVRTHMCVCQYHQCIRSE